MILNVNNDPCFEDKTSSLTLKYGPVHFFESSCTINFHACTLQTDNKSTLIPSKIKTKCEYVNAHICNTHIVLMFLISDLHFTFKYTLNMEYVKILKH